MARTQSTLPGFPHLGRNRELKKSTEAYWSGKVSALELEAEVLELRRLHLRMQAESGVTRIPVGDFSYYDPMLDLAVLFGWVPGRFRQRGPAGMGHSFAESLEVYFAMARGEQDVPALEMTKWFDTNYHYIVPEIEGAPSLPPSQENRLIQLLAEAQEVIGQRAKPVLIGPYTFLRLARIVDGRDFTTHLRALGDAYGDLIGQLTKAGAEWIQLDEPALVFSGPVVAESEVVAVYDAIHSRANGAKILLQTYFGPVWERRRLLERLPVDGLGLDLVRGPENWKFLEQPNESANERVLAAGVLDGRNVWRADLAALLDRLAASGDQLRDRLWVGTSSSLQFLPYSVRAETGLDPEICPWLAFAEERLEELEILRRGLADGPETVRQELARASDVLAARSKSARTVNPEVRRRMEEVDDSSFRRTPYEERAKRQQETFKLPLLPTTTIGSFPQTPEVRKERSRFKAGSIDKATYSEFIENEITKVIRMQEEIGLDVLVHGEFERSDMVDYFGQQLDGMAVLEHGWVQSYGTRYVRPPIIYGDVSRPEMMTVRESQLAQRLTKRPVKGMLTGPVTILNWSFPREDIPRREVAYQLALALRDETADLEAAGIHMIQIDEPAFREGLPLREETREEYLKWAVRAFRLASSGIKPETQIHTHMCYSEFNEIIRWIAEMDADVVSIENSRSSGELLRAFRDFRYERGIGPGVYDIHSPRIPSVEEIEALLRRSLEVLPARVLWANPDCGLKTRRYEEVEPSLRNLVEATRHLRTTLN